MAKRFKEESLDLLENPPPGGELDSAGPAPKHRRAPEPPAISPAVQAQQRKDRLKRQLKARRTQQELSATSGQQGGANRKRQAQEEEEANRFRRARKG